MIRLNSCPKGYTQDQDKAIAPEQTIAAAKERLAGQGKRILANTRRIDTGRLGIPVFVSECGADARHIMPSRKQMGKGASPAQAEASALMELVERYSFFSRWNAPEAFTECTWSEAGARCDLPVMPLEHILQSVGEDLPEKQAIEVLDMLTWRFHPATNLVRGREEAIPLDWFKTLNEFNGSSAGNSQEESILQGACELVERHVCALADRLHPVLPSITTETATDPVLLELLRRFRSIGVKVLLKDMTSNMPVPTVAALCHDPATFPGLSEIVFTAGTATSPVKAAIRALTEVAQLAGDFETAAAYEASGLSKYARIEDTAWLRQGPDIDLHSLPHIETNDFHDEVKALCNGLHTMGYSLYSVDITAPELNIPANYNIVPGFQFRERDRNASLGLFVGRKLAEEAPLDKAVAGLDSLARIYPKAHFIPFFQGLLQLRLGDCMAAHHAFIESEPLQPDADNQALAAFYAGYSLTQLEDWEGALPALDRAVDTCQEHKEFYNLRGVVKFKQGRYQEAARDFGHALELDRGSAMDLANLGLCHKFMGDKEQARDYLQTALELEPSLDFARKHLNEL